MAITDLLTLEPTTISRDLRDKYILLYSLPKVGKTSFAAQIPNSLLFGFERGYNALPGIYAIDIPKWSDAKAALRQLRKDEVKKKFTTITLDTISIAWDLCEEYICQTQGVKSIGDIAWGQGYSMLTREFSDFLREIVFLGYGLVMITHAKITPVSGPDDTQIENITPNINRRAEGIVNALVDLIAYINIEFDAEGNSTRTLITRKTPNVVAGTRWKYLDPKIPFGYEQLVNAIGRAIEKEAENSNVQSVEKTERHSLIQKRPFEETQQEAREIWSDYVGEDVSRASEVMKRVEKIFGYSTKLSEIKESQQDLFELLIDEMKELQGK